MATFEEIVKSRKASVSFSSLLREVEQAMQLLPALEEELELPTGFLQPKPNLLLERFMAGEPMQLTLQAIPEISVTELGWTDVTGDRGEQQVSGPERERLQQFLKNIRGGDFVGKIASLSSFYDDPDAAMATMFQDKPAASAADRIAVALSYMVFFKTLTKVISNFNAASAGFNFEAFLAVLMDGYQVPANTGTIADFISRADAQEVPVSLKLYQEKKLHVGGSFNDLCGDLIEPKFAFPGMRYVAVTKEFEGGQREGLTINGVLRWFRFDFTLDNLFDILAKSSSHSQKCVLLPAAILRGETADFAATLPGTAPPSPEELESVWLKASRIEMEDLNNVIQSGALEGKGISPDMVIDEDTFDAITKNMNWSTNDSIFHFYDPNPPVAQRPDDFELRPIYVSRGSSRMPTSTMGRDNKEKFLVMKNVILTSMTQDPIRWAQIDERALNSLTTEVASRFGMANNLTKGRPSSDISVMKLYSKSVLNVERNLKLNTAGVFASLEESVAYYNNPERTAEEKKALLKQTYGYLAVEQFNLTQGMVAQVHTVSDKPVLPEGQSEPMFGIINVGTANTQNMLNRMTTILNESLFDIFVNVRTVQDSTYSYIAGGMREDEKADEAIAASNSIITKTRELQATETETS